MQLCLKFTRFFWVIAILMMASGQIAHAYQDSSCGSEHATEQHTSDGKQQSGCPAEHACCSTHSHILGTLTDTPAFAFIISDTPAYIEFGDTAVEGPVFEIDYPPQLS